MADRALYISKKAKLGVPALFDEGLEPIIGATMAEVPQAGAQSPVDGDRGGDELCLLANDLAGALRDGGLSLHYQPICEAASGRPIVFEALARWNAPGRSNVSPVEFVSAAEQYGLIGQLTEWVLSSACREAAGWKQPLQVSVNLSPLNLRDASLVSTVARVLKDTGLAPSRLVLELTEGSVIDRSEEVTLRLAALRALGVGLWLDDFGSGYSNLDHQHFAKSMPRQERLARQLLARSRRAG